MEKRDVRLFRSPTSNTSKDWNIVELESHRQLRQRVNELIQLTNSTTITTSDMQQRLHLSMTLFGSRFSTQLVRALHRDDPEEREAIVWLLTVLNEKKTLPLLQGMSHNERLPRSIRLSASLALAGMGATQEVTGDCRHAWTHAIN